MIHVYVEGNPLIITAEYALVKVASGEWERCEHEHVFDKPYHGDVTVYHNVPWHRAQSKVQP